MSFIMTFLLTHWRLGLALLLTIVLGTYVLALKAELRYETGKRAEAETKVAQLTSAVTQWQEAVKQQNSYVDAWKAAAQTQQRLANQAQQRAQQIQASIPQKVQEILDAKIQQSAVQETDASTVSPAIPNQTSNQTNSSQPPVSCEDAIQWLRDQAPALSSW